MTGLGAITPLGLDVETTWSNALKGVSGAGPITHFDVVQDPVRLRGEGF